MPLTDEILQLLVNPTVAYLLLLVGLVGLAIELFSPGLILPGTVGAISLLLGIFGSSQLPITAAGIALLVLGVGLIFAEAQLPTSGILGAGGVVALALGGLLLFDTDTEAVEISVPVVITIAVLLGGFLAVATTKALEARRRPVATGSEEMIGATGEVRVPLDPVGQVFVGGALWRRRRRLPTSRPRPPTERGARVKVESVEGLTLRVRPVEEEADS